RRRRGGTSGSGKTLAPAKSAPADRTSADSTFSGRRRTSVITALTRNSPFPPFQNPFGSSGPGRLYWQTFRHARGRVLGVVEPPSLFGLAPRHVSPADLLRVGEDAGLDGLVLGRGGHAKLLNHSPSIGVWTASRESSTPPS